MFANEFLMLAHLGFFTFLALVFLATAILTLVLRSYTRKQIRDAKGMFLSFLILEYFELFGCLAVIVTMLIMFIKHSKTLTKKQC